MIENQIGFIVVLIKEVKCWVVPGEFPALFFYKLSTISLTL
jgi:hypothetical protein